MFLLCLFLSFFVLTQSSSWAGANSYFLWALNPSDRVAHLDAMKAAGLKVLRIFIAQIGGGAKGSSAQWTPDLETRSVGNYDDTILSKIDQLMLEAYQRGIKLNIAMHDRYALGCWDTDGYVSKYGLPSGYPGCNTGANQAIAFYTNQNIQADFDRRLVHILTHKNPLFNNRPWGQIGEAIFAFAPENEAQGHMNDHDWDWACRRANTMRPYISNGILIATGGGIAFDDSMVDNHFRCSNIDVICLHNYDTNANNVRNQVNNAYNKALSYGKRVIVEEFGSGWDDQTRANSLGQQIDATNDIAVPWMFWELLNPTNWGGGEYDFEFWTDSKAWPVVVSKSAVALSKTGGHRWPEISGGATSSGGSTSGGVTKKGDWDFCSTNSECLNNCCSKIYSNDGRLKCTPGGCSNPVPVPLPVPVPVPVASKKGDWDFCSTSSECLNGCCSNIYSNDGKYKCTPGGCSAPVPVPVPVAQKKGDWDFCSTSSECLNGCCSNKYSNDGKYKCTPGGCSSGATDTSSTTETNNELSQGSVSSGVPGWGVALIVLASVIVALLALLIVMVVRR